MRVDKCNLSWPTSPRDPAGLHAMCDYGIKAFREGQCDALRFNVFRGEAEKVLAYMAEKAPDIKFIIDSA